MRRALSNVLVLGLLLVLGGCATRAPQPAPSLTKEPAARAPAPQPAPQARVVPQAEPAAPTNAPTPVPQAEAAAAQPATEVVEPTGWTQNGIASWYGPGFQGRRTANGERFDTNQLTAAHKTLPFGTRVRVQSMVNGKEVVVRINDRGPFIKGRIIDLSRAAANAIGMAGIKQVVIERLK